MLTKCRTNTVTQIAVYRDYIQTSSRVRTLTTFQDFSWPLHDLIKVSLSLSCQNYQTYPCFRVFLTKTRFRQGQEIKLGPSYSLFITTLIQILVSRSIKCAAMNVPHLTIIFNDFAWPTIKFHDFPDLVNEILKFEDFLGFQWLVGTLSMHLPFHTWLTFEAWWSSCGMTSLTYAANINYRKNN